MAAPAVNTWTHAPEFDFTLPGWSTDNGQPITTRFYWKYERVGSNSANVQYSGKFVVDKTTAKSLIQVDFRLYDPNGIEVGYYESDEQASIAIQRNYNYNVDSEESRTLDMFSSWGYDNMYQPFSLPFTGKFYRPQLAPRSATAMLDIDDAYYHFKATETDYKDYTITEDADKPPLYATIINNYNAHNSQIPLQTYRFGMLARVSEPGYTESEKFYNSTIATAMTRRKIDVQFIIYDNLEAIISKAKVRPYQFFVETLTPDGRTVVYTEYSEPMYNIIVPDYTYSTGRSLTFQASTIAYDGQSYSRLFSSHDNSILTIQGVIGSSFSPRYGATVGGGLIQVRDLETEEIIYEHAHNFKAPLPDSEPTYLKMNESPFSSLSKNTNIQIESKLTDSRGVIIPFTGTSMIIYYYRKPELSAVGYRCTSDGEENPLDTNVRISANQYSSDSMPVIIPVELGGVPTVINSLIYCHYTDSNDAEVNYSPINKFVVDDGPWSTERTYNIHVTAVDTLGSLVSAVIAIPLGRALLHLASEGGGMGVGKLLSNNQSNNLEVGIPIEAFEKIFRYGGHASPGHSSPDSIQENYLIHRFASNATPCQIDSETAEITRLPLLSTTFSELGYYLIFATIRGKNPNSRLYASISGTEVTLRGILEQYAPPTSQTNWYPYITLMASATVTTIGSTICILADNLKDQYGYISTVDVSLAVLKLDGYDAGT